MCIRDRDGRRKADKEQEGTRRTEYSVSAPVIVYRYPFGNKLGYCNRQADRGDDQQRRIDRKCLLVIAHSLEVNEVCKSDPEKRSDYFDNDAGNAKDHCAFDQTFRSIGHKLPQSFFMPIYYTTYYKN